MIICENGQHEVNFMKWTRKKKMLFKDAFPIEITEIDAFPI